MKVGWKYFTGNWKYWHVGCKDIFPYIAGRLRTLAKKDVKREFLLLKEHKTPISSENHQIYTVHIFLQKGDVPFHLYTPFNKKGSERFVRRTYPHTENLWPIPILVADPDLFIKGGLTDLRGTAPVLLQWFPIDNQPFFPQKGGPPRPLDPPMICGLFLYTVTLGGEWEYLEAY